MKKLGPSRSIRALWILVLVFGFACAPCFGEGQMEAEAAPAGEVSAETPAVVATTPWTAAFVYAAGYTGPVHVLAPYELRHPPEYELRPGDIEVITGARYIVYAGYERMVDRIREATGNTDLGMIQITTNYSAKVLGESIGKIADELGTGHIADDSVEGLQGFLADWKEELKAAGYEGAPVVCHFFQLPLAKELGLTVIGQFGPAPIEAAQLVKLSNLKPVFIIDNWHNDVGAPLLEIMPDVPSAAFINFPGHDGTKTLAEVLRYNRRALEEVLSGAAAQ